MVKRIFSPTGGERCFRNAEYTSPRVIDSDWILQERRTFPRTFTLISSRLGARKWIHVAARRDTENWAVRKIPLGGEKKVYIRLATERRRKEISLPLNLRGTERGSLVSAKVSSFLFPFLFILTFFISLVASEGNEPLPQDWIKSDPSIRYWKASLTFWRILFKINSTYIHRARLFPGKGVSILRETRIVRSTNFLPPVPPFVTSSWNQGWRRGGGFSANSSIQSAILHL